MKTKLSSILKTVLSLLLAALFLYLAFRGMNWSEFLDGFMTTHWFWVLMSLLAAYAALIFRAERWRLQLAVLHPGIDRRTIWHGSNIGNFMSLLLPGSGEFVRCGFIAGRTTPYDKVLGTICVERAWDIIAVIALFVLAFVGSSDILAPFIRENVIAPLAGLTSGSLPAIGAAVAAVALILLALTLILRGRVRLFGRIFGVFKGIVDGVLAFGRIRGKLLFLLYTALIWLMYILMTYFTFKAVPGVDMLGFPDAVFISAIGNIASVIPTPGNLGAYHYLVGLAISDLYLGAAQISPAALLFATISHGAHAILLVALGLRSYFHKLHNRQ